MSMRDAAGKQRVVGLVVGMLGLTGCPGPQEPSGACANGGGDPSIILSNRGGGPELADGVEVPVFPPPQGGVFTELDVAIDHLAASDLDFLRITFDAADTGAPLAYVRFVGDSIPLLCNEDDVLTLECAPVAFMDELLLEDLDGVVATVTGALETSHGEFTVTHDVVLHSTDY